MKKETNVGTCKASKPIIFIVIAILGSFLMPITFSLSYKIQIVQNLLHIPAFIILTIVLLLLLRNLRLNTWAWFTCSVSLLFLVGAGEEVAQIAIPGRWPSLTDILLNIIGVFLGSFLFLVTEKLKPGFIQRIICK